MSAHVISTFRALEKPQSKMANSTTPQQQTVNQLLESLAESSASLAGNGPQHMVTFDTAGLDFHLENLTASSSSNDVKLEAASPTSAGLFTFGKDIPAPSSSTSSVNNTDDEEDSDNTVRALTYKERRREAHTQAEQKRRDAIKKGYDDLQSLVPKCQQDEALGSQKLSKAAVLQKSIDYIQFLIQQKEDQKSKLDDLNKEVEALKIMKANCELIVKAHQSTPQAGQNLVSDEMKFQVYQQIMDNLFVSFNNSIGVNNFNELSRCVFSWLEEYCKPQTLRDLTVQVLQQSKGQL